MLCRSAEGKSLSKKDVFDCHAIERGLSAGLKYIWCEGVGYVFDEPWVVAAIVCSLDTAPGLKVGWEERLFDPRLRGRLRMRLRLCVWPMINLRYQPKACVRRLGVTGYLV